MASINTVAFRLHENSIAFPAKVNGQPADFVLDTGDAVGPVFNSADAERLGLQAQGAEGVSGAGGASQIYQTTATIGLDIIAWDDEPGAIDPALQGPSLLGLPFFLKKTDQLAIDFSMSLLVLVNADKSGRIVP
jgi:predicted aspartyl protease